MRCRSAKTITSNLTRKSLLIEANTGWRSFPLGQLQNLTNGLVSAVGYGITSIGYSTLKTSMTLAQVGLELKALRWLFSERAIWSYFSARIANDHGFAWDFTPKPPRWNDNSETYLKDIWDTYGQHRVENSTGGFSLEASFVKDQKKKLIVSVHDALDRVSDNFLVIVPHSPIEVCVTDSTGRETGIVGGIPQEEIPNSIVDEDTGMIVVFLPNDTYDYDIQGRENGTYGLNISNAEGYGEVKAFEAVDIPVTGLSTHKYDVNWDLLAEGGDGITVEMDDDGDGVSETTIKAGTHLEARNTPEGTGILVDFPTVEAAVTFDEVTSAGGTFVSTTEFVPGSGEQAIEFISSNYQFNTTASYAGGIRVQISYDDSSLIEHEEEALKLFKIAEGTATDITTELDTEQNLITGVTDSFSSFAVGVVLSEIHTPAVFRVTQEGDVRADGTYYGQSFETGSADVAEWVPVSEPVEPGDVLELDPDNPSQYRKARGRCSQLIAGVVSTEPGFVLGTNPSTLGLEHWTSDSALLALIGIVPVKVTDEGGPIQPGDLLVTSSTPGHAMRWDPDDGSPCNLVGKALEPLTEETGIILVLLTAH